MPELHEQEARGWWRFGVLGWRAWALVGGVLLVHLAASLSLKNGYAIWVFGDVLQALLLGVMLVVYVGNSRLTHGRTRSFWAGLAFGAGLWMAAYLSWSWYEVVFRQSVPDPNPGDVSLFLHIVPIMGALALAPHRRESERANSIDFTGLDLLLLILWWLYLYLVIVIPWQYMAHSIVQYDRSFAGLYTVEQMILLGGLAWLSLRVRGGWQRIYLELLAAGLLYAVSSRICNYAIEKHVYYTGSIYDIPLVLAFMMPQTVSRRGGVIASRLAMLAVISLPLLLIFFFLWGHPASEVREFRLIITAGALVVLPILTFLKQHILDRRLLGLWQQSRQNFDNLRRLQEQLVQAEKLASMGELISGAAHEINNPLTAIIGYSDLLADDPELPAQKKGFVIKIGQQARRVRDLVANLRSFTRHIPGEKGLVDLNAILTKAAELRVLDVKEKIRIIEDLEPDLPPITGDANGLLQVCFHIIGNAIDALEQIDGGELRISTHSDRGNAVVEFEDNGPGIRDTKRIFDPFYTTKPVGKGTGLGLSACYGIVQNHKGQIVAENRPHGGAKFTLILPFAKPEPVPAVPAAAFAE
ncbi:MAG: ATP-binding protein [Terriglobales bacterium]